MNLVLSKCMDAVASRQARPVSSSGVSESSFECVTFREMFEIPNTLSDPVQKAAFLSITPPTLTEDGQIHRRINAVVVTFSDDQQAHARC